MSTDLTKVDWFSVAHLTEQEYKLGSVFSGPQLRYLKYRLHNAVVQKAMLSVPLDSANPLTDFIAQDAYHRGKLDLLLELISDTSLNVRHLDN